MAIADRLVISEGTVKFHVNSILRKLRAADVECRVYGVRRGIRDEVVDGNLVSARTWHDNPAWMREYVRLLRTEV
mgnify:CR=1 FL=1